MHSMIAFYNETFRGLNNVRQPMHQRSWQSSSPTAIRWKTPCTHGQQNPCKSFIPFHTYAKYKWNRAIFLMPEEADFLACGLHLNATTYRSDLQIVEPNFNNFKETHGSNLSTFSLSQSSWAVRRTWSRCNFCSVICRPHEASCCGRSTKSRGSSGYSSW